MTGSAGTVTASEPAGNRLLAIHQADPGRLALRSSSGARDPMQGWMSTTYGNKQPNVALEYRARGTSVWFVTLLASGPAAAAPSRLTSARHGQTLTAKVCADGGGHTIRITRQAGPGERLDVSATPCPAA